MFAPNCLFIMISSTKKVYAAEVSVSYNALVKGLEFHIPSGMTLVEFRDWRKAHAKKIYEALLIHTQLDNEICYRLAGMSQPKGKVLKKKGGKNAN
jgi:hypothetical protein